MSNILQTIAEATRARVLAEERLQPLAQVRAQALAMPVRADFPFEQTLATPGVALICECKKASPSKGLIAPDFPYVTIAKEYERGGAAAISVLTEPQWFLGSDAYLGEIAEAVSIPCLRKDFTVDAYMIYRAKVLGASAVLLICAITPPEQLREWVTLCDALGLSALVETHSEVEIDMALQAGARVIGVNNRDLTNFTVDTGQSTRLRGLVPPGILFVAESGIRTPTDVAALGAAGVDAVLVGEALLRAPDRVAAVQRMRGMTPSAT